MALAWLVLLSPSAAFATNGYFAHGYSARQRGMAGAGTALGGDAFAGSINPALLLQAGDRLDVAFSLFSPKRDFTIVNEPQLESGTGFGLMQIDRLDGDGRPMEQVRSDHELFAIPGIAYSHRIDSRSIWGIAVYGNGGMNTEYRRGRATFASGDSTNLLGIRERCEGAFGGGDRVAGSGLLGLCGGAKADPGVDLTQLFIVPTYARRFGALSVGVSPILAGQRFEATGLSAFSQFSESPDRVTDNGKDLSYGGGMRVGVAYDAAGWLRLGGSYQSRIYMTEFDKYKGLFADQGDFDIPSNFNVGIALLGGRHRLAIDYQRINYNEIKAVGDPFDPNEFVNGCARPTLLPQLAPVVGGIVAPSRRPETCLGGDDGPGFGWQDLTVYKFGYEYRGERFTARLGYSKNQQPVRPEEALFNILAPGVVERHFTAGLTWQWTRRFGFDFAVMYADKARPLRGKNPLSHVEGGFSALLAGGDNFGADPRDQDIELDMYQLEMTVGINYRFDH